jgi:hypothetical protein
MQVGNGEDQDHILIEANPARAIAERMQRMRMFCNLLAGTADFIEKLPVEATGLSRVPSLGVVQI